MDIFLKKKLEYRQCVKQFWKIRACLDDSIANQYPEQISAKQYHTDAFRNKLYKTELVDNEEQTFLSAFSLMHGLSNLIDLKNSIGLEKDKSAKGRAYQILKPLLKKDNFWTRFSCSKEYLNSPEFRENMDMMIGEVNRQLEERRCDYQVPPKIYEGNFETIEEFYQAISDYKVNKSKKNIFLSTLEEDDANVNLQLGWGDPKNLLKEFQRNDSLFGYLNNFLQEDEQASFKSPVFGNGFAYLKGASDYFIAKLLEYFVNNEMRTKDKAFTTIFIDISGIQRESEFLIHCIHGIQNQLGLQNKMTGEQLNKLHLPELRPLLLTLIITNLSSGVVFVLVASKKGAIPSTSSLNTQIDRSGFEDLLTDIGHTATHAKVPFKVIVGVLGQYKGTNSPLSRIYPVEPLDRVKWKQYIENLEKGKVNQNFCSSVFESVNLSAIKPELATSLSVLDQVIEFITTQKATGHEQHVFHLKNVEKIDWKQEFVAGINNHRARLKISKLLLYYCFFSLKKPLYFNLLRTIAHCDDGFTRPTLLKIAQRLLNKSTDQQDSKIVKKYVDDFIKKFRPILFAIRPLQAPEHHEEEELQVIEPIRAALATDGDTYFQDPGFRNKYFKFLTQKKPNKQYIDFWMNKAKSHMVYTAEIHFLIGTASLKLYFDTKRTNNNKKDNKNTSLMRYALIALKHLIKCNRENFPHFSKQEKFTNLLMFFRDIDTYENEINIEMYSQKSLIDIAWELFYYEIEQQPRNNASDKFFPSRGIKDPYLKKELLRFFSGIGYPHRVRYFHLSKTLLFKLEPLQMLHFFNSAAVNAYENNNMEDIHLITEAFNQYFVEVQGYTPQLAIRKAAEGNAVALNARHCLARTNLIHVRAKLSGGKTFQTKNLVKKQIREIDELLKIACHEVIKLESIRQEIKSREIEGAPLKNVNKVTGKSAQEASNSEFYNLLAYIRKMMNKRLRLQSALLFIAVSRASFSSAHRLFLDINVRLDHYIELLVDSSDVLNKNELRELLETNRDYLNPNIKNRTLYHCIFYLVMHQSFIESQHKIDKHSEDAVNDSEQKKDFFAHFSQSEDWKYALNALNGEFKNLNLKVKDYEFKRLVEGSFNSLKVFFVNQSHFLERMESPLNINALENEDRQDDNSSMKMEEFFLLLNIANNGRELVTMRMLIDKHCHGIDFAGITARMGTVHLLRHSEHFKNLALIENYRKRLKNLSTVDEEHYEHDSHWLDNLERGFIENGNTLLRVQLLTLKAWHMKILRAKIESRNKNVKQKTLSVELRRKYLNITAEIELITEKTFCYLRQTDLVLLRNFDDKNLTSDRHGFVPEYAPIFIC